MEIGGQLPRRPELTAAVFRLGDRSKRWGSRRGKTPCSSARALLCQIRGGNTAGTSTSTSTGAKALRRRRNERGEELPAGRRDRQVEAGPSLHKGRRRKRRDGQTCNAFEASAPPTPGQGSGASEGSLRSKMRRRPGQGGLAVHASGELVQIAVLLGGSPDRARFISIVPSPPCQPLSHQHAPPLLVHHHHHHRCRRLHQQPSPQAAAAAQRASCHGRRPGCRSTMCGQGCRRQTPHLLRLDSAGPVAKDSHSHAICSERA